MPGGVVGKAFLTTYVGAFELVSLLLLVAAVVAVVLGAGPRPMRTRLEAADDVRRAASRELIASVKAVDE